MSRASSVDPIPDSQIMRQVQAGQVEQLGVLFERHHSRLFNYFLNLTRHHATSEDLVQEVFLRILKYRHSYAERGPFLPWMYRIARNVHLDAVRKHPLEQSWEDQGEAALEEAASPEPTPDVSASRQQEIGLLRQALDRLPSQKREVLLMSRFQNLKCDEIARIVDCDTVTVRVRIHRALQDLKTILNRMLTQETP